MGIEDIGRSDQLNIKELNTGPEIEKYSNLPFRAEEITDDDLDWLKEEIIGPLGAGDGIYQLMSLAEMKLAGRPIEYERSFIMPFISETNLTSIPPIPAERLIKIAGSLKVLAPETIKDSQRIENIRKTLLPFFDQSSPFINSSTLFWNEILGIGIEDKESVKRRIDLALPTLINDGKIVAAINIAADLKLFDQYIENNAKLPINFYKIGRKFLDEAREERSYSDFTELALEMLMLSSTKVEVKGNSLEFSPKIADNFEEQKTPMPIERNY